jgi:glutamine amidotransferase
VEEFSKLKRELVNQLSEEAFLSIQGTTDSEHLFALFRDQLAHHADSEPLEAMALAMNDTITNIKHLSAKVHTAEHCYLNMAVSDGQRAVVSRYASLNSPAPSLWLWQGKQYLCHEGVCQMLDGARHETVLVSSEPLTADATWQEVPPNHLVLIDSDHSVQLRQVA